MVRPQASFTPADHLAAQLLALALREPFAPSTTCVPAVITSSPVIGPGARTFELGGGQRVSFGPQQQAHLADVAAEVVPAGLELVAAAFIVPLQIAVGGVEPDDGGPVPGDALLFKVLPQQMAADVAAEGGTAGYACVLEQAAGGGSCVIVPLDSPHRSISAVDEIGWIAPDIAPSILRRLLGDDVDMPVDVGPLYVLGWVARVAAAAERHGPDSKQVQRSLARPPEPAVVERMTPEKLLTAAAGGRLPSDLDPKTMRWAGPGLTSLLLVGAYGGLGQQLERLRAVSPELADKVAAVCSSYPLAPPA